MTKSTDRTPKTQPSTVCRVNKTGNFTVMSNFHLRSENLSLKAIGLLSKVLSLPPNWDYSVAGLASICKEKETAVRSALKELKDWGYLKLTMLKPNETDSGRIEYVYDFYEYSEIDTPNIKRDNTVQIGVSEKESEDSKKNCLQHTEKQYTENLHTEILSSENLSSEILITENRPQLNTDNKINNNKIQNNQARINQSPINQSACQTEKKLAESKQSAKDNDGLIDGYADAQNYFYVVKANIDYESYVERIEDLGDTSMTVEELDEIVGIIVRAVCSKKPAEKICGQEYPREVVKAALLKADQSCIRNALDAMKRTENIRNHEKFLISTLFNEVNSRHFKENSEQRQAEYAKKHEADSDSTYYNEDSTSYDLQEWYRRATAFDPTSLIVRE